MIGDAFTARACANIALVKYWGKRDAALNLPAAGSLSLTLDALTTLTTVWFDDARATDWMDINHEPVTAEVLARTSTWLDHVRALAGITTRAVISTANFFPTASGPSSAASTSPAAARNSDGGVGAAARRAWARRSTATMIATPPSSTAYSPASITLPGALARQPVTSAPRPGRSRRR